MTDDRETEIWGNKDGRAWRVGGEAEVAWIRENTEVSFAITSAIPPVFETYATLELPGSGHHDASSPLEDQGRHDAAVVAVLSEHSAAQPWWIGYLERGPGDDIVFYDVQKVRPGPTDARYVLVEAGAEQAGVWREREHSNGPLPDLMFPADRSWLLSTLGRRLDVHRRVARARGRLPGPSRSATSGSRGRPITQGCDTARPYRDLTEGCSSAADSGASNIPPLGPRKGKPLHNTASDRATQTVATYNLRPAIRKERVLPTKWTSTWYSRAVLSPIPEQLTDTSLQRKSPDYQGIL